MTRFFKLSAILCALAFASGGLWTSAAVAQATRTWVSGVGDDVNPCSRTAPCKTFAGAISKTAAGGEINCLDPGGFGVVTITKSITIDCTGTYGSILASGTTGVIVNAANVNVILRGLSINGTSVSAPGLHGIRFLQGASLHVEDCIIQNFTSTSAGTGRGISFSPSTAARLTIVNTTIINNGAGSSGGGIVIQPTGGTGNARVHLINVHLVGNRNDAIRVDSNGNTNATANIVDIDRSEMSGGVNAVNLVQVVGTAPNVVDVNDSSIFNNPGNAFTANGASTLIRASGNLITTNGAVTASVAGGTISSYGDNRTAGNSTAASFTPPTLTRN